MSGNAGKVSFALVGTGSVGHKWYANASHVDCGASKRGGSVRATDNVGKACKACFGTNDVTAAREAMARINDAVPFTPVPVSESVSLPVLTGETIAEHGMDAADIAEYNLQRSAEEVDPTPASAPSIEGYYWMRHNGHMSVENGPTVRTTDTYQLIRVGTTLAVVATISHKAGFRWVPQGSWFISTLLCKTRDGVPLAEAFRAVETYVQECQGVGRGAPTSERMEAGHNARHGQAFTSREDMARGVADAIEASGTCAPADDHFDVDRIVTTIIAYYGRMPIDEVSTPEFWSIVQDNARPEPAVLAVGSIKTPIRTGMGRRARKALNRKHKPSKACRG